MKILLYNGACFLRWRCKNFNKPLCKPLPGPNKKYIECGNYINQKRKKNEYPKARI